MIFDSSRRRLVTAGIALGMFLGTVFVVSLALLLLGLVVAMFMPNSTPAKSLALAEAELPKRW